MSVILRFPRPKPPVNPLGLELKLLTEAAPEAAEENLAWVRWMFQSIRIRCEAVVFFTEARDRVNVLADWERFTKEVWQPVLAPMLLHAWQAALADDVPRLMSLGAVLSEKLAGAECERSAAAGELLLRATQGASHPGVLGHLRSELAHSRHEAHLAMVWAAVAVLFQLPPLDMLREYLREEWLTGLREHPQPHEPQGALSFSGLAHRALREALFIQEGA